MKIVITILCLLFAALFFLIHISVMTSGFVGDERPPEIEKVIENLGIKKENILETLDYAYDIPMKEGEVGFEVYVKMSREEWNNLKNKLGLKDPMLFEGGFQSRNPLLKRKVKKLNLEGSVEMSDNKIEKGNEYIIALARVYKARNETDFLVALVYQIHMR